MLKYSFLMLAVGAMSLRVNMDKVAETPEEWQVLARSPKTQGLSLLFGVKQTNLDVLQSTLLRVSDPDHPDYGRYLTNEQVHDLIAPEPVHLAAIHSFLAEHGLTAEAASPNSDFLKVKVSVEQAEQLLQTEYFALRHKASGAVVHRTLAYSLPSDVADAVDLVAPTTHFPPQKAAVQLETESDAALAAAVNSPAVLRELYSVGDAEGVAPDNKQAVTAFLNQKMRVNDLHSFWTMFCEPKNLTCGKGDPTLVGDETTGIPAGVESMLDIQTITGVAGNLHSEFWGFSGNDPDNHANEPFLTWLAQVANTSDATVPYVFSSSYGEDEDSWPQASAERMNVEFQKGGVRGISYLFASGDEGANCVRGKFKPETPGSSPWVTAVGGTFEGGQAAVGLSSGGFSNRWAMPDYQAELVTTYMKTASNLPDPSVGYNVSGRAYPDIAAQATDFTVIANGVPLPGVAGTSCACPTASGVIALLNDARLQAGQPVLGFLNPWIYKNYALFNDIMKGSNSGGSCGAGWPAVTGWDAVTGVGSLNYKNLVGN